MEKIISLIANRIGLRVPQVVNTVKLLDEGATIPFISRYRKEMTGSMDEVEVMRVKFEYDKLKALVTRKAGILETIEEQGKLTPELKAKIEACYDPTDLEDLYLPYKPKRKTRSVVAREKGLEPLALKLFAQKDNDVESLAENFLSDEVKTVEDALEGARDIIAEMISEDATVRNKIRFLYSREAQVSSKLVKGKDLDGAKFKDYFDWKEALSRIPSHRLLAMFRGENEGFLRVRIGVDKEEALEVIERHVVKSRNESADQVKDAIADCWSRLLEPSIETEFRISSKEKADEGAVKVFAENLRQLLLSPPLGQKRILALDPGFRTGCKLVCIDEKGDLIHNETIYPHPPQSETADAMRTLSRLVEQYKIEAISIGNGTASRETEQFVKRCRFDREVKVFVVSEAGASIYSASSVAREEFPSYDVTVRGAVSIGRRLMDPLAELVKIDPKSIGVGQYQHDVDQGMLKRELDAVVESCVNNVGVSLNTASKHLLTYVSGLGPILAENIVEFRSKNGPFRSREDLKQVPRLGPKAFEQSAGFLRVEDSANPLDNSAVHPESYAIVEKMAKKLGKQVKELIGNDTITKQLKADEFITEKAGKETVQDIIKELAKPTRDPRKAAKVFEFADGIFKMEDLREGMIVPGIVTNITNFGCFVDVGVKQDGLVHVSQLANRYVSDPNEVVKLHQHVKVKVMEVDIPRKRIGLSIKEAE
ncbi:MAG TPA: RNA-binding transcriptional accessory protein [Flavobacteriales bacterium]|nr:RNA-binding transcriptional accessory protein [Flavobacteriales bacterium]HRE75255.1 Tex family protein [Flavobacteriales bacterium]HRJ35394.1 Tex family protein [Flavobacteriales bacterium]HRJ39572.1 Tex family protein [Flavobacteriales bacterium]